MRAGKSYNGMGLPEKSRKFKLFGSILVLTSNLIHARIGYRFVFLAVSGSVAYQEKY